MLADIENELNIALIYHPADKLLFSFCSYLKWNALCFSAIGCYEIVDDILDDSRGADNKSICKSRAGQCNINYVQASAAVRAGRSMNSLPSQILNVISHLFYLPNVTNNLLFCSEKKLLCLLNWKLKTKSIPCQMNSL